MQLYPSCPISLLRAFIQLAMVAGTLNTPPLVHSIF